MDLPREIDDHESLVAIIYSIGMPNLPKKSNDKVYKTIPQRLKSKLASVTGGCSKEYDTSSHDKRESWWHVHFDNFRFFATDGAEGRPGGSAIQEKMKIASQFLQERPNECVAHAMMCFCNNADVEILSELITWLGQDPEVWIPFIQEHGQKCDGRNASVQIPVRESRFKIWSGIPGTGKSYSANKMAERLVLDPDRDIIRTIFHPEYSFHDFIGQIQPKVLPNGHTISYPFVPGPFARALKRSLERINDQSADARPSFVVLCIEELNRGNAAAIFGEIFQLLDLDERGESQYGISNPNLAEAVGLNSNDLVKIPSNLLIFSTMNTSDQNIFPLDSAFLRRWDRVHVSTDEWVGDVSTWELHWKGSKPITWKLFASEFNDWLIRYASEIGVANPEDKRLGPWFLEKRHCDSMNLFANKILPYLWTNVFTHYTARRWAFSEECTTLENLLHEFSRAGWRVFNEILSDRLFFEQN